VSQIERVVGVLTGIAIFALIVNYPTVPVALVRTVADTVKGLFGLAKP
jgi:hypothetical protein